jgi:hypothetical protein
VAIQRLTRSFTAQTMPVFCTQFAVFLQLASASELHQYFNDEEAPDSTALGAMAYLGKHRPAVRDDLLCRLHGITVLEGATAETARARFVVQLKLLEKFKDAHSGSRLNDSPHFEVVPN